VKSAWRPGSRAQPWIMIPYRSLTLRRFSLLIGFFRRLHCLQREYRADFGTGASLDENLSRIETSVKSVVTVAIATLRIHPIIGFGASNIDQWKRVRHNYSQASRMATRIDFTRNGWDCWRNMFGEWSSILRRAGLQANIFTRCATKEELIAKINDH
jgi:hypothetical protein